MVQRKVPKKPGIQAADHVNSEKLLANFKPSSFQQKEIKNKGGTDLKKKMKKSRSFKKMKGPIGQPGKPPPPIVLPEKHLATPKKASPVRDTTPNYMKSTTSSVSRKEASSRVSSTSPQAFSSYGKYSIRRKLLNSNGEASSDPGNRGVRTLSRISSLKLVKTLTKIPSFKQTIISARKCSSMILSENLNVPRATCSSTMKDRKFPDYLTLKVGATDSEGTSIMKVCPYTYCSLNGHHHDSLPPLRSFLSSRRRIMKAQRSIKIGCLSPRRPKPARETIKEIEAEQTVKEIEEDYKIQAMDPGFFIEIYSQQRQDTSQMEHHTENDDFPDENQNCRVGEKFHPPNLDRDKTGLKFSYLLCELEEHSTPSIQSEEEYSEKYDMEWEAGDVQCDSSSPGGAEHIKINDMIDSENAKDEGIFTIVEAVGADCTKLLPDEILQETIYSDLEAGSGADDDSEYTSSHQNMWNSNGSKCEDQSHIRVEVKEAIPASETDSLPRMELEATIVNDSPQVTSPVIEDTHDAGTNVFKHPHGISKNLTEKLRSSIGIQTEKECEDQQDTNDNISDEVQKRSIGTQTDFEDHDQPGALKDSDSRISKQPGSEDIDNQLRPLFDDDNSKQTELGVGLSDSSSDNQSISKTVFLNNSEMESEEETNSPEEGIQKVRMEISKEVSHTAEGSVHEDITDTCKIKTGSSRVIEGNNGLTEFNPRAPNFLPAEPDPEAEKVDLRHLTLDEKKNAENWMVDHAIQQAVTKLAQARKRKVALLVEAFETVSPTPKFQYRFRHSSIESPQARAIQDCC